MEEKVIDQEKIFQEEENELQEATKQDEINLEEEELLYKKYLEEQEGK